MRAEIENDNLLICTQSSMPSQTEQTLREASPCSQENPDPDTDCRMSQPIAQGHSSETSRLKDRRQLWPSVGGKHALESPDIRTVCVERPCLFWSAFAPLKHCYTYSRPGLSLAVIIPPFTAYSFPICCPEVVLVSLKDIRVVRFFIAQLRRLRRCLCRW